MLVAEMHACLENNTPINMSNPPHREITEALQFLVYEKADEEAKQNIEKDESGREIQVSENVAEGV